MPIDKPSYPKKNSSSKPAPPVKSKKNQLAKKTAKSNPNSGSSKPLPVDSILSKIKNLKSMADSSIDKPQSSTVVPNEADPINWKVFDSLTQVPQDNLTGVKSNPLKSNLDGGENGVGGTANPVTKPGETTPATNNKRRTRSASNSSRTGRRGGRSPSPNKNTPGDQPGKGVGLGTGGSDEKDRRKKKDDKKGPDSPLDSTLAKLLQDVEAIMKLCGSIDRKVDELKHRVTLCESKIDTMMYKNGLSLGKVTIPNLTQGPSTDKVSPVGDPISSQSTSGNSSIITRKAKKAFKLPGAM